MISLKKNPAGVIADKYIERKTTRYLSGYREGDTYLYFSSEFWEDIRGLDALMKLDVNAVRRAVAYESVAEREAAQTALVEVAVAEYEIARAEFDVAWAKYKSDALDALANAPKTATAVPASSAVVIKSVKNPDGRQVDFDAYNINGSNYFKLRDLAYILSQEGRPMDVTYREYTNPDEYWLPAGSIIIDGSNTYSHITGDEMKAGTPGNKTASLSTLHVDTNTKGVAARYQFLTRDSSGYGNPECLIFYNIAGYNYVRLRDILRVYNCRVDWDEAANTITIDTRLPYSIDGMDYGGWTINGISRFMPLADAEKILGDPYLVLDTPLEYSSVKYDSYQVCYYGDANYTNYTRLVAINGMVAGILTNNISSISGYVNWYGLGEYGVWAVTTGSDAVNIDDMEEDAYETINAYRGFNGVSPLPVSEEAEAIAQEAAAKTAVRGYAKTCARGPVAAEISSSATIETTRLFYMIGESSSSRNELLSPGKSMGIAYDAGFTSWVVLDD
jgi:hypothetical protein